MTDFDDVQPFDDSGGQPQGGPGGNRTFLIVVGVVGGIFLLFLIGMVVFLVVRGSQPKTVSREGQAATINAQNTATVLAVTQQYLAMMVLTEQAPTAAPTATKTPKPTATQVLAQPTKTPTTTKAQGVDPRTQTVVALLTQAANALKTTTALPPGAPTSTALPKTGFADEVGIPGLVGLTVVLLVVIFLARRLRVSSSN